MESKNINDMAEYHFNKIITNLVVDYTAYEKYQYIFFMLDGLTIFEYDEPAKILWITYPNNIVDELNGLFSWKDKETTIFIGNFMAKKYNLIIKKTNLDVPF
jgi:hypothetical protein